MLANFFEGVKDHDQSEMGKNVYKKGYPAEITPGVNWHGLPYNKRI